MKYRIVTKSGRYIPQYKVGDQWLMFYTYDGWTGFSDAEYFWNLDEAMQFINRRRMFDELVEGAEVIKEYEN